MYRHWSHLDHAPHRLLAYMAFVTLDQPKGGTPARRYFGGWEALAGALGHEVPAGDDPDAERLRQRAYRNTAKTVTRLTRAGAIVLVVSPTPGRRAEYDVLPNGSTSGRSVEGPNGSTSGSRTDLPQDPNGSTSGSRTDLPQVVPKEKEEHEEEGRSRAPARDEPPPRCPNHIDHDTDRPCHACGQARRAREAWQAAQDRAKASLAAELDAALADPRMRCDHGTDGGLFVHPITGKSATCALCRRAEEQRHAS